MKAASLTQSNDLRSSRVVNLNLIISLILAIRYSARLTLLTNATHD